MMSSDAFRVVVVDDDEAVRRSLENLLLSAGHKVLTFASAKEFESHSNRNDVGCLVLDIGMPGMSGMQLQQELASESNSLPIVFLTGQGDISKSVQAMKRGAVDFLTKPVDDEALLGAIAQALEKRHAEARHHVERNSALERIQSLTSREREVLGHVVAGEPNKLIADLLGAAEATIKVHRSRVMAKLGVNSVAELVRLCAVAGLEPVGNAGALRR